MDDAEELRRVLRAASGPRQGPGAAARIAEGAWSRAEALRREEAEAGPAARPMRLARVWSAVAAAGVAVAAAGIALRTSTPAFAVEGDPVKVLRDGAWADAKRVETDAWVFSPAGNRTILAADGGSIAPRPGSVFRVRRDSLSPGRFRVEIRAGEADVAGHSFVLAVGDGAGGVEVKRSGDAPHFAVFVSAGGRRGDVPPADPGATADPWEAAAETLVRVVAGEARVGSADPLDLMILRPLQEAVTVTTGSASPTGRRLTRSFTWSEGVVPLLARDFAPCGAVEHADGDVFVAIRGDGDAMNSIRIPSAARSEAISLLNLVQMDRASGARIAVHVETSIRTRSRREYEHEKDGRRTLVTVEADGTASLAVDGGAERVFPSLDALRAAHPAEAALFGDALP